MAPRSRGQRRRAAKEQRRLERRALAPRLRWRDVPNTLRDWSLHAPAVRNAALSRAVVVLGGIVVAVVVAVVANALVQEWIVGANRPVATVYSEPITAAQYAKYLKFRAFELQRELAQIPSSAGTSARVIARSNELQASLAGLSFDAATELAEAAAFRHEAAERGVSAEQAEVAEELDAFVEGPPQIELTPSATPTISPTTSPAEEATPDGALSTTPTATLTTARTPTPTPGPEDSERRLSAVLESVTLDRSTVETFLSDRILRRKLG